MTTIRDDVLSFAAEHPGFRSSEVIQHLADIRGTVNPANVTTLLREMTIRGELVRSPVAGSIPHRPRFCYDIHHGVVP